MSPVTRVGLAFLVAVTAFGAAGCCRDGRHLRSPYPRGSECERRVCRNLRDLGVDRSELLHNSWCEDSRSDILHEWWRDEPCCR